MRQTTTVTSPLILWSLLISLSTTLCEGAQQYLDLKNSTGNPVSDSFKLQREFFLFSSNGKLYK